MAFIGELSGVEAQSEGHLSEDEKSISVGLIDITPGAFRNIRPSESYDSASLFTLKLICQKSFALIFSIQWQSTGKVMVFVFLFLLKLDKSVDLN